MKENPTVKDLKQFKISLLLFPIIPAIILFFKHHELFAYILLGMFWSVLFFTLFIGLFWKNADKFSYKCCRIFLNLLGSLIAAIALIITWICTILPTGLLAHAMHRDRLNIHKQDQISYWKNVKNSEPSYENQY